MGTGRFTSTVAVREILSISFSNSPRIERFTTKVNMTDTQQAYDPFFNVRKGGPKEKRIRRVELMGEHKPKPIYYVKVIQSLENDLLSDSDLRSYFESR